MSFRDNHAWAVMAQSSAIASDSMARVNTGENEQRLFLTVDCLL